MTKVFVSTKEIEDFNIIMVEVGTNCPRGGDTGHGGRTIFSIKNLASTDMRVGVNGDKPNNVESFDIIFGGDSECETFIKAVEHAVEVLKSQYITNNITKPKNIL